MKAGHRYKLCSLYRLSSVDSSDRLEDLYQCKKVLVTEFLNARYVPSLQAALSMNTSIKPTMLICFSLDCIQQQPRIW